MYLQASIRNSFILLLVGICFEVKKKLRTLQIRYTRTWSQEKTTKQKECKIS